MNFNYISKTDIGLRRTQNQDNYSARPELGLFVVADGMGGHKGGEVASAIATQVIPEFVQIGQSQRKWEPRQLVLDSLVGANEAIYLRSSEDPDCRGMGTTVTSVLFTPKTVTVGHVGDSRCYYFKDKMAWQLTRDHSLVQEKLRAGLINRAQAKNDQMKNVITRSVGFEPRVQVDIYEMPISENDLFLICSDGLSGMIEDEQMFGIIQKEFFENKSIEKTSEELISVAKKNGGEDNITLIMTQFTGA